MGLMGIRGLLIAAVVCFALGACHAGRVALLPGASNVEVKREPPPGGVQVSTFTVVHGSGCYPVGLRGTADGVAALVQNKAVELGANYMQITSMSLPESEGACPSNRYTVRGVAFRVGGRGAEPLAITPTTASKGELATPANAAVDPSSTSNVPAEPVLGLSESQPSDQAEAGQAESMEVNFSAQPSAARDFVLQHLGYAKQVRNMDKDSSMWVATADVNEDGKLDYFISMHGLPYCGTGARGCAITVHVSQGSKYVVALEVTAFGVSILKSKTNGVHDLSTPGLWAWRTKDYVPKVDTTNVDTPSAEPTARPAVARRTLIGKNAQEILSDPSLESAFHELLGAHYALFVERLGPGGQSIRKDGNYITGSGAQTGHAGSEEAYFAVSLSDNEIYCAIRSQLFGATARMFGSTRTLPPRELTKLTVSGVEPPHKHRRPAEGFNVPEAVARLQRAGWNARPSNAGFQSAAYLQTDIAIDNPLAPRDSALIEVTEYKSKAEAKTGYEEMKSYITQRERRYLFGDTLVRIVSDGISERADKIAAVLSRD